MLLLHLLFFFSTDLDWINAYEVGDCGIRHKSSITDVGSSEYNGFPWHAALYRMDNSSKYEYICGASIIDTHLILTNAHCVFDEELQDLDNRKMVIAIGKTNSSWEHRSLHEQRFEVTRKELVPTYRGMLGRLQDDIALLRLNETIKFSNIVMPVCIDWEGLYEPFDGEVGTLAGWSLDEKGVLSEELNIYQIQQLNYSDCFKNAKKGFASYLTSDKYCGINKDNNPPRQGSTGGGLVFSKAQGVKGARCFIKGLLSGRVEDRENNYNYIITNISDHVPWLKSILDPTMSETNVSKESAGHNGIKPYEIEDCSRVPSKDNEFPWHVALYKTANSSKYEYICGGSIINTNVVLTAAHCVFDEGLGDVDSTRMVIVVGKKNSSWEHRDVQEQRFEVISKILRPTYRGTTTRYQDDIALLVLNDTITFSTTAMPVCIDWEGFYEPNDGEVGTIIGWGINEKGVLRDELKISKMQKHNLRECRNNVTKSYGSYLTSDKFCAVNETSNTVELGYAGGGLVFSRDLEKGARHFLKGIVSGRERGNDIVLFTNITNHIPWLKRTVITIITENSDKKNYKNHS
nr:transmembrane protease serine 9-like [Halyomorpha halys]